MDVTQGLGKSRDISQKKKKDGPAFFDRNGSPDEITGCKYAAIYTHRLERKFYPGMKSFQFSIRCRETCWLSY